MPGRPRYPAYALEKMAQRGISTDDVEAVLISYDHVGLDKDGNSRLSAEVAGRRLIVVVARDSDPPLIITAWPLRRGRRPT